MLIVVGLLLPGGVYFGWMLILRRDVPEADPSDATASVAAPPLAVQ